MKHAVLVKELQVDENHQLHINIPPDMGRDVKVIVFSKNQQNMPNLTEEEVFNLAAYAAITEDDSEEDAIWKSYVRN
jgi:hypothetical protein